MTARRAAVALLCAACACATSCAGAPATAREAPATESDAASGAAQRREPAPRPVFVDPARRLPLDYARTWAVELGDLDGDGDLDLFLATREDGDRLWLGDGAGRFSDASERVPRTRAFSADAALGDVDGDGDLDVALACFGAPSRLLANAGDARFSSAPSVPRESLNAQCIELGDLDGDGDLDALLGTAFGQPDRVWENKGGARFEAAIGRVPVEPTSVLSAALGDVDGDGDLDAWLGTELGLPHRLYLNDGSGTLRSAGERVPPTSAATHVVRLFDADGDGDLDAFAGNGGQGGASEQRDALYSNDGSGRFAHAADALPPRLDFTVDAAPLDADGDGDLDVALACGGLEQVWLLNDGAARFTAQVVARGIGRAFAAAAGDVDGDRDTDVVLGVEGGPAALLANHRGSFTDVTAPAPFDFASAVSALALGDLDGDGDLDLVVGCGSELLARPERDRVLENDGTGLVREVAKGFDPEPEITGALALGDLDGDGFPELVAGTAGRLGVGRPNRVYANRSGSYGRIRLELLSDVLPSHADPTTALALGDADGDGDLDLYVGNGFELGGGGARDRLYQNDGRGVFADVSHGLPPLVARTRAAAFGDADGDGDLDLLLSLGASRGESPVDGGGAVLFVNAGAGGFAHARGAFPAVHSGSADSGAAVFADVDADGDPDAVFAGRGVDELGRLFENDGAGRFREASERLPAELRARAFGTCALAADLDGDGHVELVTGAGATPLAPGGVRVAWNEGRRSPGRFSAAAEVGERSEVTALAAGDLDGDGSPDLVVGSFLGPLRVLFARPPR